tara:strand:- start:232 stop:390 length:159 start_codon:yes stop_codon:yes gene_type:complete
MKFLYIFVQVCKYGMARRKYWLIPFATLLVALGIILVASQGSVIAPFIYTLF